MTTATETISDEHHNATRAVLTVGTGRGFVVEGGEYGERYVITAAHCLPHFPPCHGASYRHEHTYKDLLAPLGEKPSVWAECLFDDPIADIAVLGAPDSQMLRDKCDAYEALVGAAEPLVISDPPLECSALLLSLDNKWFRCRAEHQPNGPLSVFNAIDGIVGGMSGSPMLALDGTAIGVVCLVGGNDGSTEGGPNPRLCGDLPGRLQIVAKGRWRDAVLASVLAAIFSRRRRRPGRPRL